MRSRLQHVTLVGDKDLVLFSYFGGAFDPFGARKRAERRADEIRRLLRIPFSP